MKNRTGFYIALGITVMTMVLLLSANGMISSFISSGPKSSQPQQDIRSAHLYDLAQPVSVSVQATGQDIRAAHLYDLAQQVIVSISVTGQDIRAAHIYDLTHDAVLLIPVTGQDIRAAHLYDLQH
jgi:hypothetical protein